MEQNHVYSDSELDLLATGRVPQTDILLDDITTGIDFLTDFLTQKYLDFYIRNGGSKIKFLTGRTGSGKTHFSRVLTGCARNRGYLTVSFSATDIWLHDFSKIYLEILRQCNLQRIIEGCAHEIIREMGFDPEQIKLGQTFMDYLSEQNEADALTKSAIRSMLREKFTHNPLLDNTFSECCSLMVGGFLGHPILEPANREAIMAFMHGDKSVKLSQLRAIGISPCRINKHNARHLLRSLAETVRMAGYSGIFVSVDDMEILQHKTTETAVRYTKIRRDDAYESIRQMIDDIDSMRYIFFLFSFDRELIDNESYGIKSYQALWFRIQNEIIGTRFNRFADIIDMDRLADQIYTPQVLVEMSRRFANALNAGCRNVSELSLEVAEDLLQRSQYGGIGLPYIVIRSMMEGEE